MPYVSETRFRVRYAETDQMGMVYYANYLIWMELGRTDFCRECGFTYRDLEQEERTYLTVAEATCAISLRLVMTIKSSSRPKWRAQNAGLSSSLIGSSPVRRFWRMGEPFTS